MRTFRVGLVVLALAGCHKNPTTGQAGSATATPTSAGSAGSATPAPAPGVTIFVDDANVGTITPAQIASWQPMANFLPASAHRLGMWQDVYLIGDSAQPTQLHQPTTQHPNLVPALFPGDDGSPSFGMFDPVDLAKHTNPQMRTDHVHAIRLKLAQNTGRGQHDQSAGSATDPKDLQVHLVTKKGQQVITGTQLLAIPRTRQPGDETGPLRGWQLAEILDKVGVKKYQTVNLTDETGASLTLDKKDFDAKSSIPFIKLNRSGQLRVRVFKRNGKAWQPTGDLRGLIAIEIVK